MTKARPAIAAFDLATTTGWAYWFRDGRIVSGSHKVPGTGIGEFILNFESWLYEKTEGLESFFVEAPIVTRKTNQATTCKLVGTFVVAQKVACMHGITCTPIAVPTWRKSFLGRISAPKDIPKNRRRKWLKDAAIAACRDYGWQPCDDNAADALGLLYHAVRACGT